MARTMLSDGRSFIEDTIQAIPLAEGSRPDKSREEWEAERQADRVPLSEVCKAFSWTPEQLDHAIGAYAFPKPIGREIGKWHRPGQPIYSRNLIRRWHEAFTGFARTVPRKVF